MYCVVSLICVIGLAALLSSLFYSSPKEKDEFRGMDPDMRRVIGTFEALKRKEKGIIKVVRDAGDEGLEFLRMTVEIEIDRRAHLNPAPREKESG